MDISKTLFKEYSKCERMYSLDIIHKQKYHTNYQKDEIKEILSVMFDELGEDEFNIDDPQLEVMLPYYQKVEEIAIKEASKVFKKEFTYFPNTLDQKSFSFKDNEGNSLYTYLDGYYEDDDEIIVIEVKATTDRKFLELGPTIKKELHRVFEKKKQVLFLKEDLNDKQLKTLEKIYDRNSDVGKYFHDLAITNYIIQNSKIDKPIRYYLAVLNSRYIFNGEYINGEPSYYSGNEGIITFIEANKLLKGYYEIIIKEHQMIQNVIKSNQIRKSKFKKECKECLYKKLCFEEFNQKYSIATLMAPKKIKDETIYDLYNRGVCYLKDIEFSSVEKENHQIQLKSLNCEEVINQQQIEEKLNQIEYPIYHLDFEGFNGPLPRFKGEFPYMQSIFQYSIHIEKEPNLCERYKDNYAFIPNDFLDHREELIQEMIRIIDLSNGGTVLVYNKAYESTRIKELIKIFPKYQKELSIILDHIYDLKDVIKGSGYNSVSYYHRDLEGSYSIKKVLPIFSNLTYKDLMIHNGVEAIVNYAKFKDMEQNEIEEIRNNLIEYCGLDTYSMFVILKEIKNKIKY